MKKKIIYSERLFMVAPPESNKKLYFSSDAADGMAHFMASTMAFRKHRNSFEPLKTPHVKTHKKGSKIRSIYTFRKWCMTGHPIYYNHKFMHYGFAVSMPFRAVAQALTEGRIWKAVRM